MANELRVRSGFLGGLIEDNPLTLGATTLTSAALASVPVIGSTQHLALVLDPDGFAGNPEIVYITAHSAAATTATILRAQESSTARAHDRDMAWVHSVTVRDFDLIPSGVVVRGSGGGNIVVSTASTYSDVLTAPAIAVAVDDVLLMRFTGYATVGGSAGGWAFSVNGSDIPGSDATTLAILYQTSTGVVSYDWSKTIVSGDISAGTTVVKARASSNFNSLTVRNDGFGKPHLTVMNLRH